MRSPAAFLAVPHQALLRRNPLSLIAVLLAEHAAWSGEEEHALLAAEWCREGFGAEGTCTPSGLQAAAHAQLHTAKVLSGADRALPQPRARY